VDEEAVAVPMYLFQGQPMVPGPTLRMKSGDTLTIRILTNGHEESLADFTIHGLHLARDRISSQPEPFIIQHEYHILNDQPPGGVIKMQFPI